MEICKYCNDSKAYMTCTKCGKENFCYDCAMVCPDTDEPICQDCKSEKSTSEVSNEHNVEG